jgi:D-alanyl-D-alanine dipeptidase
VRTAQFEQVSFSTGHDGLLWPGSGVLFQWRDRAPDDLVWLSPIPEGLEVPDAPPLALPSALGAPGVAVPEIADGGEPLVELPETLARQAVYDEFPLTPRGPLRLRRGLVDRLVAVDAALPARFSLVILDGWRPLAFQHELLALYRVRHPDLAAGFVADPDVDVLAPHTTGGAVDLTLAFDGVPLALGTDFDAFVAEARLDAFEDVPGPVRDLRRLLARSLTSAGLAPYPQEWWHWSYGEQWWAAAYGEKATRYGIAAG